MSVLQIASLMSCLTLSCVVPLTVTFANDVNEEQEPLDFGFIKNPPGQLVTIGSHRLHAICIGEASKVEGVTVLFETGLGGSSLEWQLIQQQLPDTRTCAYDRAGYAWSDPSPFPRTAGQIAREADAMLRQLGVEGPLILVGHSFGGFAVRMLAGYTALPVVGMVLIESSHEEQFTRMEQAGFKQVMPTGKQFVISAAEVPDNLPSPVKRKIQALSRMRKSYAATHGEMSGFRRSAQQVKSVRSAFEFPVAVLSRGQDPFAKSDRQGAEKNRIWQSLQKDLASLSSRGYSIVAENSGHHVHVDEPQLVINEIEAMLDEYKKNQNQ